MRMARKLSLSDQRQRNTWLEEREWGQWKTAETFRAMRAKSNLNHFVRLAAARLGGQGSGAHAVPAWRWRSVVWSASTLRY